MFQSLGTAMSKAGEPKLRLWRGSENDRDAFVYIVSRRFQLNTAVYADNDRRLGKQQ